MKIGTIETLPQAGKNKRRFKVMNNCVAGGKNRQRSGNGGGGDGKDGFFDQPKKDDLKILRLSVFFVLLMLTIFSAMLAGAYILISLKSSKEWMPFDFPVQLWLGTFLLAASSIAFQSGVIAFNNFNLSKFTKFLTAVLILGGLFFCTEISTYYDLDARNIRFIDNPFGSFVFVSMTFSALILLCGIIWLAFFLIHSRRKKILSEDITKKCGILRIIGWYWHFSVGLWISLFSLLILWQ